MDVTAANIVSTLADDLEFRELLEMFVKEIPDRVNALVDAVNSGRNADLRRIAHQMKGAGGGYGFPQLSAAAAQLQHAVDEQASSGEVERALAELLDLCRRVRL